MGQVPSNRMTQTLEDEYGIQKPVHLRGKIAAMMRAEKQKYQKENSHGHKISDI